MSTGCGLIVDWDLKTTLDGLYAAGDSVFGSNFHSAAATGGRWAGAHAAAHAKKAKAREVYEPQVEKTWPGSSRQPSVVRASTGRT